MHMGFQNPSHVKIALFYKLANGICRGCISAAASVIKVQNGIDNRATAGLRILNDITERV
jgi:hypothetical protein